MHTKFHENPSATTEFETQNTQWHCHILSLSSFIHFVMKGKWVKMSCDGGYWVHVVQDGGYWVRVVQDGVQCRMNSAGQ